MLFAGAGLGQALVLMQSREQPVQSQSREHACNVHITPDIVPAHDKDTWSQQGILYRISYRYVVPTSAASCREPLM